jgi:hypothetical protein
LDKVTRTGRQGKTIIGLPELSNIKNQAQFAEQERHMNKIKLSTRLTTKDGIVIAFLDGQQ